MKKALIIAAGTVESVDCSGADCIIAADGGYDAAERLGIKCDLFVGDMDSVKTKVGCETVLLNAEKDFTDTECAIEEAVLRGYKRIDIYGATGTRLDHTLANIFMMKKYLERGIDIRIIDEHNKMRAIKGENVFHGIAGKTVSFIPADSVVSGVTLEGVKYPLFERDIEIGTTLTVSNIALSDPVTVRIKKGTLIMILTKD